MIEIILYNSQINYKTIIANDGLNIFKTSYLTSVSKNTDMFYCNKKQYMEYIIYIISKNNKILIVIQIFIYNLINLYQNI